MRIRTGVDVTDLRRVRRLLDRYGDHFPRRFFPRFHERHGHEDWVDAGVYGRLWSAKEAVFKVLGRGYRWTGVFVDWGPARPPTIHLDPEHARLGPVPVPSEAKWHCSVAGEEPYAFAAAFARWGEES